MTDRVTRTLIPRVISEPGAAIRITTYKVVETPIPKKEGLLVRFLRKIGFETD